MNITSGGGHTLGWFAVFVLCVPTGKRRWYSVVLATWVAFGAAAMFTTMANRWVLWVIPGILLLAVLRMRSAMCDWPSQRRCFALIGGGALLALAGIVLLGKLIFPSQPSIALRSGWVRVGTAEKREGLNYDVWIASPDPAVLGKVYGRRLRTQPMREEDPAETFLIEWRSGELSPGPSDAVVFSGKGIAGLEGERLAAAAGAGWLVLLNPDMPSQALIEGVDSLPQVRILWGEFHTERARYQWDAIARDFEQIM